MRNSHSVRVPFLLVVLMFASLMVISCGKDPATMSDAELGLNAEQSSGRKIFNIYCMNCHPAYSTHGNKGPGLKGLYGKPYLPSGLTATDEHVVQSIIQGRGMMPRFGDSMSRQEIQAVVAYLHTL
jgi:mono/diheme cytochrome c family protein